MGHFCTNIDYQTPSVLNMQNTGNHQQSNQGKAKPKTWNYHPQLPVTVSPLFITPLKIGAIIKWFFLSWFPISERLIILCISVLCWLFFSPSVEQTQTFEWGWVVQIYLRNLLLMIMVAGGLHCYLYVFRKQGDELQYDTKPFAQNKSSFTFNNQVWDNIFWSCASGVTIWTAYEALMLWSFSNGYSPQVAGPFSTLWLIGIIFFIPIWETFYFYLIHRLLHVPVLYKFAHSLHHRNTNVGPWSGFSMHPFEHLIYLASVLIHFLIPSHPLLIIFHLQFYALSAATTHTGFAGLLAGDKKWIDLGTFHHQLHHRYFECNFGALEIPWDKWFGSFHDGTEPSHQAFMQRRREQVRAAHKSR